jgi:hypothetical protein
MFVTAKVSGILSGFVGRMFSWSWSAFIEGLEGSKPWS